MGQQLLQALTIVALAILLNYTKAAVTSKGELVKFYRLNALEYSDLRKIIKDHTVVNEDELISAGHRSIAEWSKSMPDGWNKMLKARGRTARSFQNSSSSYPLCLLQANGTRIRRQIFASEEIEYAGVAPNEVYTIPIYPEYIVEQQHNPGGGQIQIESPPFHPYPDHPEVEYVAHPVQQAPEPSALVNCVVILRRTGQVPSNTSSTLTTLRPHVFPPYSGWPYPYPPPQRPPSPFPNYPPPAYFYPPYPPRVYSSPTSSVAPQSQNSVMAPSTLAPQAAEPQAVDTLSSAGPQLDPGTLTMFRQIINDYYQALGRLFLAGNFAEMAASTFGFGTSQVNAPSNVSVTRGNKEQDKLEHGRRVQKIN